MGKGYIISAGHALTAEGAKHAFESGGNAFDAALAGWLSACLAEPVLTSPGGSGFAMVAPASGQPRLYDFFSQTPRTRNPDGHAFPLEADFGATKQIFHLGAGTVATPGCVAGMLQLQEDFGCLPLKECAAHAMELSRSGLAITSHAAKLLEVVNDLYRASESARVLFNSKSDPDACLREGELFLNRDFEGFLENLVTEGSRWFYKGDIGRIVGDYCRDHDGHLTRDDFLNYQINIRDPLEIRRKGARIWLNPPPSMGGTLIAIGLLSRNEGNRAEYPFSNYQDWQDWVDPIRLMSLLRSADGMKALQQEDIEALQTACSASTQVTEATQSLFPAALGQIQTHGTTHISIMDKEGNEIALTTSNGSGSAIIAEGTGFMLNNMLGEEDLQPEGIDTWRPNTRLSSMMAPTLGRLADGTRIATGSGGSNRIRSTILQILRHLIDQSMNIEEAVLAPRLHWEDGQLHAESEAADQLAQLEPSLPWPIIEHSIPNLFFGGAHSIVHRPDKGFDGMGDPRRGGVTITG